VFKVYKYIANSSHSTQVRPEGVKFMCSYKVIVQHT